MAQVRLTSDEQRELLIQLRAAKRGSRKAKRIADRLLLACRGYIVKAATECAKATDTPIEDLVQEGMLAVLPQLYAFDPSKSPAQWAFPGFVFTVARRAMYRYARTQAAPVHITDHAHKQISKAKHHVRDGGDLTYALRFNGASESTANAIGDGRFESTNDLAQLVNMPADAPDPASLAESADLEAKVLEHLHRLPPRLQCIIRQTYGIAPSRQLPDREIARRQKLTLPRLQERRNEAIRQLRSYFAQEEGDADHHE